MKKTIFNAKRVLMALVAMLTIGIPVWGEEVLLFGETFGTGNGSGARDWSMDYKDQSGVTSVYSGASYTVTSAKQTKNSTDAALNTTTNGTEATFIVGPLNVSSYESLKVTFNWNAGSTGATYYAKLYYATSESGSYTEITKTTGSAGSGWYLQTFSSIPVAAQVSTLYLKVAWSTSNTNAMIDDFSLYGTEVTKTLSSIALKTSATKTAYVAGEDFAPAGIVITATYSDASTEDIDYDSNSAKFSFSPNTSLTAGTTSVTVTYGGKTCTQTIAVYAVTVQAKDENDHAIAAGGPGAPSRTGASITCAADALNYKFWKWEVTNASVASSTNKTTTISSPTGAVTVTAKYYLPRTVTWKVNGDTWTPSENSGTDGTSEVKRETTWSALTLPTDPTTSDGCGNKFLGWTPEPIEGSLDKTDDADAISTLESTGLLNSGNKSSKSTSTYKIMNNTTFHAVFADYAE